MKRFYPAMLFVVSGLCVIVITTIVLWDKKVADSTGSICRQLAMACLAYPSEQEEVWPPSLPFIVKWSDGELDEVWERLNTEKLHYYRPDTQARAMQPAIVYELSTVIGPKCVIVYCDGHVGYTNDMNVIVIGNTLTGGQDYDNRKGGINYKSWLKIKGNADW